MKPGSDLKCESDNLDQTFQYGNWNIRWNVLEEWNTILESWATAETKEKFLLFNFYHVFPDVPSTKKEGRKPCVDTVGTRV